MTFEEEVLLKRHHCIDKQKVKEVIDKKIKENNKEIKQHKTFIRNEIEYCKKHNKNPYVDSAIPQVKSDRQSLEYDNKKLEELKKELGLN